MPQPAEPQFNFADPLIAYAYQCAWTLPTKANAIACVRDLVEAQGIHYRKAVAAVIATFPLGLMEYGEISEGADRKYGGTLLEALHGEG